MVSSLATSADAFVYVYHQSHGHNLLLSYRSFDKWMPSKGSQTIELLQECISKRNQMEIICIEISNFAVCRFVNVWNI